MKSLSRIPAWLAATLVVIGCVSRAAAQYSEPACGPFLDPFEFGNDLQFFKQADITEFGGGPEPNTGWYGSYQRLYLGVTRPETALGGDFAYDLTWANRWELGYMTAQNHGWQGTMVHMIGPGIISREFIQELDAAPADIPPTNHIQVDTTRNFLKMNSWDVNKTCRIGELYHGGYLEPYAGFRYMELRDYSYGADVTTSLSPAGDGTQLVDYKNFDTKNRMLGGQLGTRYWKRRGRWDLSADLKCMVFNNFQDTTLRNEILLIDYPAGTEASRFSKINYIEQENNEVSVAMELRTEAAFEVTRDISLTVGFEYLQFFKGVSRGFEPFRDTDEPVVALGATWGVTVNR